MISPKGLKEFKVRATSLLQIAIAISDLWNTNELTLTQVLVQNVAHDASNCVGYKHEEEVIKIKRIIEILNKMAKLNNHHTIAYIYDQLNLDLIGISMSEDDNQDEDEIKSHFYH